MHGTASPQSIPCFPSMDVSLSSLSLSQPWHARAQNRSILAALPGKQVPSKLIVFSLVRVSSTSSFSASAPQGESQQGLRLRGLWGQRQRQRQLARFPEDTFPCSPRAAMLCFLPPARCIHGSEGSIPHHPPSCPAGSRSSGNATMKLITNQIWALSVAPVSASPTVRWQRQFEQERGGGGSPSSSHPTSCATL